MNLLLDTDSYKSSHYKQYPEGTTSMFSYFESRGGRFNDVLFFGLQAVIKKYLCQQLTFDMVEEAKEIFEAHGEPFNYNGWKALVYDYDYLPVRIRAVPEGMVIPTKNVLFTVESIDPRYFWVVGYIETFLSRVWYPCTVATLSFQAKKRIKAAMEKSCDNLDGLPFKLHDFGSRGSTSAESAAIGGLSHLVNFLGTDTVVALLAARRYYQADMAGFSIPAAEHSTITSWGKDGEIDAYRNMLKQFGTPGSLLAVVSDSYDLYNAVDNIWGGELKQEVIDSGATLVIRPDSGDPATVVLNTLTLLGHKFGYVTNSKGFRVLRNVRVIQGDGMNLDSLQEVLDKVVEDRWSIDNLAFGMGAGLLQKVNRDTQRFAYKCSSVTVNGVQRDVFKNPVTDPGKKSKKGRLTLLKDMNGYTTVRLPQGQNRLGDEDVMRTVYENGVLVVDDSLEVIKNRASLCL